MPFWISFPLLLVTTCEEELPPEMLPEAPIVRLFAPSWSTPEVSVNVPLTVVLPVSSLVLPLAMVIIS
jgi:hypothetical protein